MLSVLLEIARFIICQHHPPPQKKSNIFISESYLARNILMLFSNDLSEHLVYILWCSNNLKVQFFNNWAIVPCGLDLVSDGRLLGLGFDSRRSLLAVPSIRSHYLPFSVLNCTTSKNNNKEEITTHRQRDISQNILISCQNVALMCLSANLAVTYQVVEGCVEWHHNQKL